PQVGAEFSRFPSVEADRGGGPYHERVSESWSAVMDLPWSGTWRAFELRATASGRRAWDYWRSVTATPEEEVRETLFSAAAAYDSTRSFAKSIGASGGLSARAAYTRLNPGLSGDASWVSWNLSRPTAM